jgi:hypothetical protein
MALHRLVYVGAAGSEVEQGTLEGILETSRR